MSAEQPALPKHPSLGKELTVQIHRRAYELAGDGEWHDFEDLLRELAKMVPPGIAMRRSEYDRMRAARKSQQKEDAEGVGRVKARATKGRVIERDKGALIRGAARRMVRMLFIATQKKEGYVSPFEVSDGKIRYIRTPMAIRSDQLRAEVSKPILDDLAEVLIADGNSGAIDRLREAAHNQGYHLKRCPKGCILGGQPAEQ